VSAAPVAGTEDHPQARIVLGAALATQPSHAYLFHGPAGTGKSHPVVRVVLQRLLRTQASPACNFDQILA